MNREIKYLLEEIKDNTQDYIGTNGCLYQDLLREELNLLLGYISNLQNQVQKQKESIDKVIEIIEPLTEFDACTINGKILRKPLGILKEVSE